MTPLQFQNESNMSGVRSEENIEGKGDGAEISDGDYKTLFPSCGESISTKRKKSKDVANKRSTKGKTKSFEDKLEQNREAFMYPKTHEEKIDILKKLRYLWKNDLLFDTMCDHYSFDDEDSLVDEDIEFKRLRGIVVQGIVIARDLHNRRTPCHTSGRTRHMFISEILNGHPRWCYEIFRLDVPVFKQVCIDLVTNYGLKQTRSMSIQEPVRIFLMTLAHGCTNRFVQESFNHSGETIHRHFHRDYIGAIDGTHVRVGRFDEAFNTAQQESYNPRQGRTSNEEVSTTSNSVHNVLYMAVIRDIIAQDIMDSHR
ncbi:hypothetical protein QVD17_11187 [Tagetes erecta]|uniref:DUF8040 domain-containing protein n=1 Tax=Tagetes erecta TaxID=13708 RepID=A0AAD8P0L7_TARER|nr:hypothetical protein QVD17_11187 [Tagetes erecta]